MSVRARPTVAHSSALESVGWRALAYAGCWDAETHCGTAFSRPARLSQSHSH